MIRYRRASGRGDIVSDALEAGEALGMDLATLDGAQQGAAGFLAMTAVAESTAAEKGAELDEAFRQLALVEMP